MALIAGRKSDMIPLVGFASAAIILVVHGAMALNPSQSVRIVATGKASGMPVVRAWVLTEPSIDGTIIPTREAGSVTGEEIVRLMRIYFPRTYEDLVTYDFLLLAQVDMAFISPEQATWMHDAIAEEGLGGANTRSVMSMNVWLSGPWAESILSNAFPNEPWAVIRSQYYLWPSGSLVVNDDESLAPVMRPFKADLETRFPAYGGLLTVPRVGSRIHSWLRTQLLDVGHPRPGYVPHIFEWDYQEGITFTFMDMVYDDFWNTNFNPFALDIVANVIWHASHRDLPEDPLMVHALRQSLQLYRTGKTAVLSVFDFAEKFGANMASTYSRLGELDSDKSRADALYLEGDYDGSYELVNDVAERLNRLAADALRLKDQAMFWVYVVEWMSVAGTSLLCGTALWVLMIRRSLFREAGKTRWDEGIIRR